MDGVKELCAASVLPASTAVLCKCRISKFPKGLSSCSPGLTALYCTVLMYLCTDVLIYCTTFLNIIGIVEQYCGNTVQSNALKYKTVFTNAVQCSANTYNAEYSSLVQY